MPFNTASGSATEVLVRDAQSPFSARRTLSLVTGCRVVVASILAIGWGVAIAVYLTATPVAENTDVDDMLHSKKYLRELEGIGGKAAVFTSELNDWVAGLWHGKTLAYTIAVITALVAGAYCFSRNASRAEAAADKPPR